MTVYSLMMCFIVLHCKLVSFISIMLTNTRLNQFSKYKVHLHPALITGMLELAAALHITKGHA